MKWDITPDELLNKEAILSLTDFIKILWDSLDDITLKAITDRHDFIIDSSDGTQSRRYNFKDLFFIQFFNLLFANVLGYNHRYITKHCKKVLPNSSLKIFFSKSENAKRMLRENEETILVLNAVIKRMVTEFMENGISLSRITEHLNMQRINSLSYIISDIRKNDTLREMLIPFEFSGPSGFTKFMYKV